MDALQLYQELSAHPAVEVVGIVAADGVPGVEPSEQSGWTLLLSFEGWRSGDGLLRQERITARRNVSNEDFQALRELLRRDTMQRINARIDTLAHDSVAAGCKLGTRELCASR